MLPPFSFRFLHFEFYKQGRDRKEYTSDENDYGNYTSYHGIS